ncbi:murein hydrolase activator EnvC family protein [Riemerella columbipharyngis]|uniref:Septal ring factor EnvC, activator of murein hydrolases AmiA and AmiB n=1 Tax=Riemerella columbipharyngis TaxID=1071918 RepID=A0A1G7CV59_9FLAO|nr:M23 family metallopeptidase [Riemerella columbipharyngis]SDE43197.1 Septal ring factor EnvC, activator of murein hydrolases AmiA and AmiB [Riemerella columbipharyngis]
MTIKKFFSAFAILFFGLLFSQQKEKLQKQNAELKKQIKEISKNLAKTKKEARLSVAYLTSLNKKISLGESVYQNTQKEKRFIEDDIYLKQLEINKLKRELSVLRQNYERILVNAYKNKGIQNKVTFILSAKNLGQALRRIQYLKQYSDYQDKKASEINDKTKQISQVINLKKKSVQEKEQLLAQQQKNLADIQTDRDDKAALLEEFKKNETQLTAELKQKQAQSTALESQIRKIIREEIAAAKAKAEAEKKARLERERLAREAAAREKARIDAENKAKAEALRKQREAAEAEAARLAKLEREKAAAAEKAKIDAQNEANRQAAEKAANDAANEAKAAAQKLATAKAAENDLEKKKAAEKKEVDLQARKSFNLDTNSSADFAANRGKLLFPAAGGQIVSYFGRHPHPVYKHIMEENNGIKIAVPAGGKARCVFSGIVSKVVLAGGAKTVIIKHGAYFSIYGNLANTSVSENQSVSAGMTVGTVAQDYDGAYILDFQIWNGTTPIDPQGWISR